MRDQNVRVEDPQSGRVAAVALSLDESDSDPAGTPEIVRAVWEDDETALTAEEIARIKHLIEGE